MKQWFVFFFLAILACLVGFSALIWKINNSSSNNKCEIIASYSMFLVYSKNKDTSNVERYYSETALKYCDNSWTIINNDGDERAKRHHQWFMDIADRILIVLPMAIKNGQKQIEMLKIGDNGIIFDVDPQISTAKYFKWNYDGLGWLLFDMNIHMW
jgi:hypothetical protein